MQLSSVIINALLAVAVFVLKSYFSKLSKDIEILSELVGECKEEMHKIDKRVAIIENKL